METSWTHQLEQWREFFLLCGTAGVTLTGVLFIVISLGPSIIAAENATGVKAFISPNAVYFTSVLVVSVTLMAPSLPQDLIGWLLCIGAALSLLYLWSVKGPQRWRENGLPLLDWIWYIALPYLAYALALAAGIGVLRDDPRALTAIAATLVAMLVIGIRNAWDLAVWLPLQERNPGRKAADAGTTAPRQRPRFRQPNPGG
jgi:hypothetical protein